jgi:hypothetical protein
VAKVTRFDGPDGARRIAERAGTLGAAGRPPTAMGLGDRRVRRQESSFEASSSDHICLVVELEPEGVGRAL